MNLQVHRSQKGMPLFIEDLCRLFVGLLPFGQFSVVLKEKVEEGSVWFVVGP